MEETIIRLIESIETIAPEAWKILVYQANIEAVSRIVWGIIWLVIAFPGLWTVVYNIGKAKADDDYDWNWVRITSRPAALLLALIATSLFVSAIKILLNPGFKVIDYILSSIK